ncbi:MAG TPA: ABC transporter permease DevC [Pirellulales bacterium]|jgi:putative ABC transport system permease protein|nr:ABC transporter permease DevC [Pirellulales bacterium]
MKTPLAWRNLLHEHIRTGVAVAGVAFAVILVLMQLGFFFTVERTATLVYDRLNFDIALLSHDYLHMGRASHLPVERLYKAQELPEVRTASPFWIGFALWRNADPEIRSRRGMMIMAFRPDDPVFKLREIQDQSQKLKELRSVLVDRLSRPEFGPHTPGTITEAGQTSIKVVGEYTMGTGFTADGGAITSDATFFLLGTLMPPRAMSLGLVTLADGADADAVKRQLQAIMPGDTQVMTRADLRAYEQHHWVVTTSVGTIFGLGVGVAMLVGLAIVYQVLSSDIANRIPEYATLMAMGYGRRYISGVVIRQALMLAVAGFVPGWLISYVLYKVTAAGANLPMKMTPGLTISVLLLNVAMCATSGLLSLRKVNTADPADLFV